MCLALYLSSSKTLPVLPFDPEQPGFHVHELSVEEDGVRAHFTHPHVYYVGSTQGCSCAFNYEHEFEPIRSLQRYLKIALADGNELEGFSCRSGREGDEVKHSTIASPEMIVMPRFYFYDGHFLQIVTSVNSRGASPAEPVKNCAPGLMAESFIGLRAGAALF